MWIVHALFCDAVLRFECWLHKISLPHPRWSLLPVGSHSISNLITSFAPLCYGCAQLYLQRTTCGELVCTAWTSMKSRLPFSISCRFQRGFRTPGRRSASCSWWLRTRQTWRRPQRRPETARRRQVVTEPQPEKPPLQQSCKHYSSLSNFQRHSCINNPHS